MKGNLFSLFTREVSKVGVSIDIPSTAVGGNCHMRFNGFAVAIFSFESQLISAFV